MCKVRKFYIKKGEYGGNTLVDIGKMRVLTGRNKCETEWNKNCGDLVGEIGKGRQKEEE